MTTHTHPAIAVLADTFHLLGDPSRLAIVFSCMNGPTSVGDIAQQTGLGDSLVSHHLRLLKAARLVCCARDGKRVLYEISDHHIATVLANMNEHISDHHAKDHP